MNYDHLGENDGAIDVTTPTPTSLAEQAAETGKDFVPDYKALDPNADSADLEADNDGDDDGAAQIDVDHTVEAAALLATIHTPPEAETAPGETTPAPVDPLAPPPPAPEVPLTEQQQMLRFFAEQQQATQAFQAQLVQQMAEMRAGPRPPPPPSIDQELAYLQDPRNRAAAMREIKLIPGNELHEFKFEAGLRQAATDARLAQALSFIENLQQGAQRVHQNDSVSRQSAAVAAHYGIAPETSDMLRENVQLLVDRGVPEREALERVYRPYTAHAKPAPAAPKAPPPAPVAPKGKPSKGDLLVATRGATGGPANGRSAYTLKNAPMEMLDQAFVLQQTGRRGRR